MMTCEDAQVLISAALDGELSAGEEREFSRHVQQCAPCAARFDRLQQAQQVFRDARPGEYPEVPASTARRQARAAAVAAAAMVLLAAAAWLLPGRYAPGDRRPVSGAVSVNPLDAVIPATDIVPGLDCRVRDPGPTCEVDFTSDPCASAEDCGLTPAGPGAPLLP